jgi:hypothetical protein
MAELGFFARVPLQISSKSGWNKAEAQDSGHEKKRLVEALRLNARNGTDHESDHTLAVNPLRIINDKGKSPIPAVTTDGIDEVLSND